MYVGDGDVACDQYHKYKVGDPWACLEKTKRSCCILYTHMHAYAQDESYIRHCSIFMLFT